MIDISVAQERVQSEKSDKTADLRDQSSSLTQRPTYKQNTQTLLETLEATAVQQSGSIIITDVKIGQAYTAVQLSTGSVGLAHTFGDSGSIVSVV